MFPNYPIDIANKAKTKKLGRINPNGTFSLENSLSFPILKHNELFRPEYVNHWIDIEFGVLELISDSEPEPLNGVEQYSIYGKTVPAMVLIMINLHRVIENVLSPVLEERNPDYVWIPYNSAGIVETDYDNQVISILNPICFYFACVSFKPPENIRSKLVVDMFKPKNVFIPEYRIKGHPPYRKQTNTLPLAI